MKIHRTYDTWATHVCKILCDEYTYETGNWYAVSLKYQVYVKKKHYHTWRVVESLGTTDTDKLTVFLSDRTQVSLDSAGERHKIRAFRRTEVKL